MPEYYDFYLYVNGSPDNYTVEARGPGEIAVPPTPFIFTPTDQQRQKLDMIRDGYAPEQTVMRELGELLYTALFPRSIVKAFARAHDEIPPEANLRLKLVLRPPELNALPWELLYDPDDAYFIAARLTCPIVRFIESQVPVASLAAPSPLRVLYVQSQPKGSAPLDLQKSEEAIQQAFGMQAEIVPLYSATPTQLRKMLRQSFHILHYDGHAIFDEESMQGALCLQDARGKEHRLSGEMLANYLDGASVRVVVLSACQSGMDSTRQRFAGIAQQIMKSGSLPAVVAMQFSIPDDSAIAFNRGFYQALADGFPVDAAVTEGRKQILDETLEGAFSGPDWATPVLFMRSKDGEMFPSLRDQLDKRLAQGEQIEMERRLEAAMPAITQAGVRTEVRALVSLPDSPGLRALLPAVTASGELIVQDDTVEGRSAITFLVDPLTRVPHPVDVFFKLNSLDFEIETGTRRLRVSPFRDSALVTFFLIPHKRQEHARVVVELYEDPECSALLGSVPLVTEVRGWQDEVAEKIWNLVSAPFNARSLRPHKALGARPPRDEETPGSWYKSKEEMEMPKDKSGSSGGGIHFGDHAHVGGDVFTGGKNLTIKAGDIIAAGGSVNIAGGSISQNNYVYETQPSKEDFAQLLEEIRKLLKEAQLDDDTRQAVQEDLDKVDDQASKEHPKKAIITSKLKSAAEVISAAGSLVAAGQKFEPLFQKALELAQKLF